MLNYSLIKSYFKGDLSFRFANLFMILRNILILDSKLLCQSKQLEFLVFTMHSFEFVISNNS